MNGYDTDNAVLELSISTLGSRNVHSTSSTYQSLKIILDLLSTLEALSS